MRPTKRGQNTTNIVTGGWIHASNLLVEHRPVYLNTVCGKGQNVFSY